jgi:hypothetical protein
VGSTLGEYKPHCFLILFFIKPESFPVFTVNIRGL